MSRDLSGRKGFYSTGKGVDPITQTVKGVNFTKEEKGIEKKVGLSLRERRTSWK